MRASGAVGGALRTLVLTLLDELWSSPRWASTAGGDGGASLGGVSSLQDEAAGWNAVVEAAATAARRSRGTTRRW